MRQNEKGNNDGGGDEPGYRGDSNGQQGARPVKVFGLFVLLFAIWLAWSGLYKPLVVALGIVSCLLCVWITRRMHSAGSHPVTLATVLRAGTYMPWLLKEIALANWQVIRIVLSPSLPVQPTVIQLTGSQRSELGRVVYGNSITLTPGTLTMDVDGDRFTVHALTSEGAAQLQAGEMNDRVTRMEGGA